MKETSGSQVDLRTIFMDFMKNDPRSYRRYAREIGITLTSFFNFMHKLTKTSRVISIKIENFLKKNGHNEKNK